MNKETLRYIKNDMWQTLYNKKDLQAYLKRRMKELEAEKKKALEENKKVWFKYGQADLAYWNSITENNYNERKQKLINNIFNQWHNDQSYYLIYEDGSDISITAEEILNGEKFPKMSGIVYAELLSADEHIDTEKGDLDWYSDETMQGCGWDYEKEDKRKWKYDTAIQYKFNTEWSIRYRKNNPEFVPMAV